MASSSWPATDSKICIELYVIRYYTFVIRTIPQSFSISTLIKAYQSFALAMEIRSHIHVEFSSVFNFQVMILLVKRNMTLGVSIKISSEV